MQNGGWAHGHCWIRLATAVMMPLVLCLLRVGAASIVLPATPTDTRNELRGLPCFPENLLPMASAADKKERGLIHGIIWAGSQKSLRVSSPHCCGAGGSWGLRGVSQGRSSPRRGLRPRLPKTPQEMLETGTEGKWLGLRANPVSQFCSAIREEGATSLATSRPELVSSLPANSCSWSAAAGLPHHNPHVKQLQSPGHIHSDHPRLDVTSRTTAGPSLSPSPQGEKRKRKKQVSRRHVPLEAVIGHQATVNSMN